MKRLLLILAGSSVIFLSLSMAQEWEVFVPLFSGGGEEPGVLPELPKEALEAIDSFNTILVHVYRLGGDQRFMDRLPASERVRGEVAADLDYLKRNGVVQEMKLLSMDPISATQLGEDVWEVVREESWRMFYLEPDGTPYRDPPMTFVGVYRYVVRKDLSGWTIQVMEPADEGA